MAKIQLLFTFFAAKLWSKEAKFNTQKYIPFQRCVFKRSTPNFMKTFGDKHIIIILITIN